MAAPWRRSFALILLAPASPAWAQTASPVSPPALPQATTQGTGPYALPGGAPAAKADPTGNTDSAKPADDDQSASDAGDAKKGIGPLSVIGNRWAHDGIRIRALLTNDVAGNVTGGVHRGTGNVGQFYIGADLDMNKLVGWKGGALHFTLYHDYGRSLAKQVTGTFIKQQGIYKNDYTQWHMGLISIEQKLLHDRVDIIAGRLGSTAFYGHLQSACFFQQGLACGIPAILNSEAGYSLLPSATWGANVKAKVGAHGYVQTGIFEVNPFIAHTRGLDFSIKHATGFTVPFELAYDSGGLAKTRYPFQLKVGGYASTGTRVDPYYNAQGQSAGLTGTAQRSANTLRSGFYILAEKTFWRPDPKSTRSLTAFGGYLQPLENEEVVDRQLYAGLVLRGPFKSRPRDSIGLMGSYLHVSSKEVAYLRDTRLRLGGGGVENPNEYAFEASYGLQIGRSIRLTPNVQYIVHPDNSQLPKITFVPKNMVTFGLRLVVNVATLAGMPPAAATDD
ncbi:carbohydrate porin [Novosphingobium sp. 9]|uniref:carbohydrate porin n=1 Tax=Novosphingobium sp. 9 TaxID=2025349 RepID=UPI0021B6376C|nr:carbohydrate porin [Novosphingobium sp. 9]